jgi:hypothetical protein
VATIKTEENQEILIEENGKLAKNFEILITYASKIQEIQANGSASGSQINPNIPVTKPKSIITGIKARTKTFAGKAKNESVPIE